MIFRSLFDKPVVQPSVPHSVSSAPDISIKRNYSECLPAAFPNQRFGQQSVDPRLAYPAAPDSLQNMITLSNPSTGFYLPGTCAPVQSTYLTSSLPPTSIGEPISRSQSRSRHTSSRRSSRSVLDDDRRSRHRSRSRRKLIVEKLHPSAQSGASCVRMSTTYNCPHRNKLPSNCCMTMIPSTSNNYLNSHIPASCLCPHSCPAWSSTMECCPHHPHPYLESTPTRPTVLQQSTRWPHGTVWPITYHSPCPVRENSQQAYNYSQPVSHLQSVQQNSKMLPPFPPPYQIPADLSQTQQTTQVAAPNQTVSPMIRLPSAIAHPNTYPQTAHPPTPSLGHHPNLSHVPIRQTAAPHQLAQATFAHPPIAYYGNPAPGSPNHSLQFGGFQKEINSRMHADLEPRNYVHQKNHEKEVSAIQPGRASFHAPAQSDLMSASENQPKQFEHGGSKFVHNVTLNPNEVLSIPATRKEGVSDNVRIHIPRQIIPEKDHPTNSSVPNTMKTGTLSPQTHHHHHHQQQQQQQQQHQQQQQMPKESQISPAPFRSVIARRANLLAEPSTPEDWKKVEQRFDQLQREKTMLESKLCRLPPRGNYSKPSVVAEEERINDDLSRVEKEMSALRLLMHRRFVENRRLRSKAN
ncbi:hypothetical protein EG68_11839 [Paragonimus skrjabini miyazakii]|uniref:Uncharacterized protein n=1 Tax=Paragonimus skrjabini miyazakii TaxID=59628 RepID=A0A8S9YCY8_9TREM|nr:hypothetical protein EG68_11839 [Paragonimus skrjabini miyazakii]